ncbi:ABC transporter permease [Rhizobium panacihumi]|uniref:ABC transporter permease n=1 Tax=Rhizobium panacihumi TaxID=2008450 RepID=UPI003D7A4FD1
MITLLAQAGRYRGLIYSLVHRDITMRFRQSAFSFLWLILQPICMLLVYSFVFQVVMRVRWHDASFSDNAVPVGLILFTGLSIYAVLAETLIRCPAVITGNTSYVKKVVFPLALLPVVVVLSALVLAAIAFALIAMLTLFWQSYLPAITVGIVVPMTALFCMCLGIGWFIAALGVYFRDVNQIMPFLSTIILFTAPICYPKEIVPEQFRFLMAINPLTIPVETIRSMLFGGSIDFFSLITYCFISLFIMFAGYAFFQRLRIGFADVL